VLPSPEWSAFCHRIRDEYHAGWLPAKHRDVAIAIANLNMAGDWSPTTGKIAVTAKPNANVQLEVWGNKTTTVFEHGAAAKRDLLGTSAHAGSRFERVTLKGRGVGQFVYADVFLPKTGVQANYTLSVAPAAR